MGKVATGADSARTSQSLRPMKSRASMWRPSRLNFRSLMDASSSVKKLRCVLGASGCAREMPRQGIWLMYDHGATVSSP